MRAAASEATLKRPEQVWNDSRSARGRGRWALSVWAGEFRRIFCGGSNELPTASARRARSRRSRQVDEDADTIPGWPTIGHMHRFSAVRQCSNSLSLLVLPRFQLLQEHFTAGDTLDYDPGFVARAFPCFSESTAIPICGTALRSRCSIVDIPRAGAPICPAFSRSIGLLALMTFATGVT